MSYTEIIDNIDSGKLNNLYLLYGRESYLIEDVQRRLKSTLNEFTVDFNISVLDGESTDYEGVISAIETLPFMDDRRIVIIKNFELLQGKRKLFSDKDEKNFIEDIKNIPSTTILVFSVEGDVDKRKKLYKEIKSSGEVHIFDKLKNIELSSWCRDMMKKNSVDIMDSDIIFFIEMSGYNNKNSEVTLLNIKSEIEKLSAYSNGSRVNKEDIKNLLHKKSEGSIYDFISCIASRDSKRAVGIYRNMLEDGNSVLGIISLLARQFGQILKIKYLREKKVPRNIIIESVGVPNGVYTKLSRQSENFGVDNIIRILEYLSEIDYKIKNGLINDEMSIEILIAGLTR